MDISTQNEGELYIIKVKGDLDASSSIIVDNALLEAIDKGETKIAIDCSDLDYISSPGLGVFISYLKIMKEKNISLVLYGLNETVKTTFTILGLDELMSIVENKEEAIGLV